MYIRSIYDDIYIYIYIFICVYTYIYILYSNFKSPLSPKTNLTCNRWNSSNSSSFVETPEGLKWLDSVLDDYVCKVFRLALLVCCFYGIMSCVSWKQAKTIMHFFYA